MIRILLYGSGFILMVIGFFYLIIYTNLFTFGYSLKEYMYFMLSHIRNYALLVGLILVIVALCWKGVKKK